MENITLLIVVQLVTKSFMSVCSMILIAVLYAMHLGLLLATLGIELQ